MVRLRRRGWQLGPDRHGQLGHRLRRTARRPDLGDPPATLPETELGWILLDTFEGRGIACEAATLALAYTRDTIRPASLVSYIDAHNTRSIALAKRLGATLDATADRWDDADVVYRHNVGETA